MIEASKVSETQINDRVDRMLNHLDRLLDAGEMDTETYNDAVRGIALWEERAMLETKAKKD
jgi:hypothetical protein